MEFLYTVLKEIGFGHPLHPPLTHMPTGLTMGAFILFCTAPLFRGRHLREAAHYCTVMALIFLFPAAFFGFTDWDHFYAGIWSFAIVAKIVLTAALAISLAVSVVIEYKKIGGVMSRFITYFVSLTFVVGIGYFGGALVFPDKASGAPNLSEGERLFGTNCAGCHPRGENVINPALPVIGSRILNDLDSFTKFNRNPLKSDGSKGTMPAFPKDKVSDQELKQLYEYLKSIDKKK
ncbi:MAG: c-type cytochrome [Deltaproteobacteria bacterium]|nr:c-type cytochrome [Deltaproteobacteria bacterium]